MRARYKLGRTRAPSARVHVDTNLAQIWASDGSGQTRRFGCVASLGRALTMHRSGQTTDACGRDASARWRSIPTTPSLSLIQSCLSEL
jgi:hypothetical protein